MNLNLTYDEYETIQGDTFDSIALDFYDEEYYASEIINANPDFGSVIIFDEGIVLKIPLLDIKNNASLPPWKR
ncbi:tail protein X [Romboutsia lituseburensis]|uniref:tail protein X n=1 Tax=Romboutsia lituseburensis TaxID=1537 RepID=UPI0022EB32A5|nr:tail protein X [Romboutsia lituseburensis]